MTKYKKYKIPFNKSFASHEKSKFWIYDKNQIDPKEVPLGCASKFWFFCDKCNHSFEKMLSNVTNKFKSSWCPYCSTPPKKLCDENCNMCFQKSFASIEYSKNIDLDKNNIDTRQILKYSDKYIWFKCPVCLHSFGSIVKNITRDYLCPFCVNQKLCGENSCEICYKKSLASSTQSQYWNYSLNKITPLNVFLGSNTRYYFDCHICKHAFSIKPCEIGYKHKWCTYCSGGHICDDDNCIFCFNNSFASHPKSKYWSEKNNIKPRQVFKSTNKSYLFNCPKCHHESEQSLCTITEYSCPFCSKFRLCSDNNCQICFDNSFASNKMSIYFNVNKNSIFPRHIFKGTAHKYYFTCNICNNEFIMSPSLIMSGCWCSCQNNKTETKVKNFLLQLDYDFEYQKKFDWLINNITKRNYKYDFVCDKLHLIIEIDGLQHFKQVSKWKSPEDVHNNDIMKLKKALDNNYSIIRILQEDIWMDKIDWKTFLNNNIKSFCKPTIIFQHSPFYNKMINEIKNYKSDVEIITI